MLKNEQTLKKQVVAEVAASGRLISDVAEEYGLSNKRVYEWVKLRRKKSKQRKSKAKYVS